MNCRGCFYLFTHNAVGPSYKCHSDHHSSLKTRKLSILNAWKMDSLKKERILIDQTEHWTFHTVFLLVKTWSWHLLKCNTSTDWLCYVSSCYCSLEALPGNPIQLNFGRQPWYAHCQAHAWEGICNHPFSVGVLGSVFSLIIPSNSSFYSCCMHI